MAPQISDRVDEGHRSTHLLPVEIPEPGSGVSKGAENETLRRGSSCSNVFEILESEGIGFVEKVLV